LLKFAAMVLEWVQGIAALATVALVGATLLLVNKTRIVATKTAELVEKTKKVADRTAELVNETIRSTDQLDRHHQEALLPMVYVEAGLVLAHQIRNNERGMLFSFVGELVNVGAGPSTSVNVLFHPAGIAERSFYQGMIGANSRRTLREVEWWIPLADQPEGNRPFEVTTKYETLFDTVGHTIQRNHSGLPKDIIVVDSQKPIIRPRRLQEGSLSVSGTATVAPGADLNAT
jgi:hypothetical protein